MTQTVVLIREEGCHFPQCNASDSVFLKCYKNNVEFQEYSSFHEKKKVVVL